MVKRKGLPELNELVICTVKRVTPYAAWCNLEEYENVEGMVHISEVAGKWVYDIKEFVKVGKQFVAKVMRVDRDKSSVNLSMKRVSRFDEKEKLNAYRKEQRAEKILEQIARMLGKNLEQAYEEFGYLLQEKFGELYVAVEEAKESPENLLKVGVPKEWVEPFLEIIKKSFKEKEIKLKAELELKNYSKDGVEKIKNALNSFEEKTGANVKYISAPKYMAEIKTKDPKNSEKKLKEGLEFVVKEMKELNGEGNYKMVK